MNNKLCLANLQSQHDKFQKLLTRHETIWLYGKVGQICLHLKQQHPHSRLRNIMLLSNQLAVFFLQLLTNISNFVLQMTKLKRKKKANSTFVKPCYLQTILTKL